MYLSAYRSTRDHFDRVRLSTFAGSAVQRMTAANGSSPANGQILRHRKRVKYLLALLVFIRAAHFWTAVHPGLEIEDDVRELMSMHKELASLLLQDPDPGYR